jgi:catechol 2,3-dioxygenase-like lactoylglutathione lyase family enzyme
MDEKTLTTDLPYDGGLTCAMECADLQTSVEWYQAILGFELLYVADELAWAELRSPVARVNIGLSQVENPSQQGGATLTWGTTDLDGMRARLEAANVRFDGDTQEIPDMVRLATFFDPDGNTHMLYQDIAPQGGET